MPAAAPDVALVDVDDPPARATPIPLPGSTLLTPRAEEVLRLVARGWSNAESAERLVLGEGTVKTHLAHVLAELGVRDRGQAVVAAYDSGPVRPGGRSW